eukprot:Awhi_evm1s4211
MCKNLDVGGPPPSQTTVFGEKVTPKGSPVAGRANTNTTDYSSMTEAQLKIKLDTAKTNDERKNIREALKLKQKANKNGSSSTQQAWAGGV